MTVHELEDLGPMVRRHRSGRRLSLREASEESGVPFSTLSRIEKGRLPDLVNFRRIVEWLGVPVDEFFSPGASVEATPSVIAEHLRSDPALTPDSATKIAGIVRDLYDSYAVPDRRLAVHLRAAKTFSPPALLLLTGLLDDMQEALEARLRD